MVLMRVPEVNGFISLPWMMFMIGFFKAFVRFIKFIPLLLDNI